MIAQCLKETKKFICYNNYDQDRISRKYSSDRVAIMSNLSSVKQQEIYKELLKLDKKAAEAYQGALRVLKDKENPDRFPQAAHSLREVSALISRKISIPQEMKKSEGSLKTKLEKQFVEKLELLPSPAEKETGALLGKLVDLHSDFFVPVSHHGKDVNEEGFYSKLSEFETIVIKFLKPIPISLEELDSLLSIRSPSEDDIKRLTDLLKHPTHVNYFFSRLSSPEWLSGLKEKGFFSKPFQGIRIGDYITFPVWPLSGYLTKVAGEKPKEVMNVIKNMQDTDNHRVLLDLIDCALQMPSFIAKEIIPLAKKWSKAPYLTFLPEKIGEFCIKLSNENEVELSLDLLDALLEVKRQEKEGEFLSKKAQSNFDLWEYNKILKKVIPEFLQKDPNKIVEILCKKLYMAVNFEISNKNFSHDRSYIWRPAIEKHEDRDIKNILVTALKDSLKILGKSEGEIFKEYIMVLSKYDIPIFRRIELHLMKEFSDLLKGEIDKVLSRKDVFDDVHMWHEYYHLLQDQYSNLSKEIREKILKWIDTGPDLKKYESWFKKETRKLPTKEQKDARKAHWQIRYLSAIKDIVPTEWKKKWTELKKNYVVSKHPDYHIYTETRWTSPKSPLNKEEMSSCELINFLEKWEPSKDKLESTTEGLGIQLRDLVILKPSDFTKNCHRFKKFHPIYIYQLIDGFREAAKKGSSFDWKPVIILCFEVITITEPTENQKDGDRDYDWKNAQRVIADFIREGLGNDKVSPPFELRGPIFEIIKTLLLDDEPTPLYEEQSGRENLDAFTLSLNTIRGKAMHALIEYALWCVKHLDPTKKEDKMVPEVKEQLEKMLNPELEPTMTIRSVYGESLPNLFYLHKDWAEKNLEFIFPEDVKQRVLWKAAWEAYISYSRFFFDIYGAMQTQYKAAVNKLESPRISERVQEGLAVHLMIAYLRGFEKLSDGTLIKLFFSKATTEVRRHAIWFIGNELEHLPEWNIEEEEKEAILMRLMNLWEWRIEEAGKANRQVKGKFVQELIGFGMWFINTPFDKTWSINQLVQTLELTEGKTELENGVIDNLHNYTEKNYLDVLRVLNLIVKGDIKEWIVVSSKEKIKKYIESIKNSHSHHEIREYVNDLVNNLTKKGYHEFAEFYIK